jgi:hypothetical protein
MKFYSDVRISIVIKLSPRSKIELPVKSTRFALDTWLPVMVPKVKSESIWALNAKENPLVSDSIISKNEWPRQSL